MYAGYDGRENDKLLGGVRTKRGEKGMPVINRSMAGNWLTGIDVSTEVTGYD